MADQTVSNLLDIQKEVWTDSTLNKQFYDEAPWLDRLEKSNKYTIGKQAQVPIHHGRSGADTTLGSAGGTLNAADPQDVEQGVYTLSYNWRQISTQFGALNQVTGGLASVVEAKNLEIEGAISDMRKSVLRQALSNGDAQIAECTTTSNSTTVNLLSTGYGYDAIVRGWLRPGQTVDIGTAADEVSATADKVIVSVSAVAADPEIVLGTAVTTAALDYVSISNARLGTASNEMHGLRSIAGSTTTTPGGLLPATTHPWWKPAAVNTTDTVLSLDVPLNLQRDVFQQTGKFPTFALTSIKQLTNLYSLLQNQVRFTGDIVKAGNVMSVTWNGMNIEAQPDVPDREFYLITPEDLLIVTGKFKTPTWASNLQGASAGQIWNPGSTNFVDGLVYPLALAVRRRNTHAAARALTA